MLWGLIPTFVEVTREKLVEGLFTPPPSILNRVNNGDFQIELFSKTMQAISDKIIYMHKST